MPSVNCNLVTYPHYVNTLLSIQRQVDDIYFDFGSVFDRVSHTLLPRKLSSIRLASAYVSWFSSHLTDRFSCIRISGIISGPFRLLSIVPSVLGPQFFGAFPKSRKATISFVTSVRLSVCPSVGPHRTTRLPVEGFSWNVILLDFSKIWRENSSFIKIEQEQRALYVKTNMIFLNIFRLFLLRISNVSDKSYTRGCW
jgi:hypothetical protein